MQEEATLLMVDPAVAVMQKPTQKDWEPQGKVITEVTLAVQVAAVLAVGLVRRVVLVEEHISAPMAVVD